MAQQRCDGSSRDVMAHLEVRWLIWKCHGSSGDTGLIWRCDGSSKHAMAHLEILDLLFVQAQFSKSGPPTPKKY